MTASRGERRRRSRRTDGLALALLPLPLLLEAILSLWGGQPMDVLVAGGGYAAFVAAALLMNRGRNAEDAYRERPFAGSRPLPLKSAATLLVALTTAVLAHVGADHGWVIAAIFGAVAAAGARLLYGGEPPLRAVRAGGAGDADLASVLREAYDRLDRIEGASRLLGTASPAAIEFKQRIGGIVGAAEKVLKLIEEDPRDLRRARKFLNVYLAGAEEVCSQFARTHPRLQTPELEHSFRTLLVEIENTCTAQYETLLQHDVLDLDVQIEVLSARLRHEGVR